MYEKNPFWEGIWKTTVPKSRIRDTNFKCLYTVDVRCRILRVFVCIYLFYQTAKHQKVLTWRRASVAHFCTFEKIFFIQCHFCRHFYIWRKLTFWFSSIFANNLSLHVEVRKMVMRNSLFQIANSISYFRLLSPGAHSTDACNYFLRFYFLKQNGR